jgi:uncharacterized protein YlxW (UPF0749 family)
VFTPCRARYQNKHINASTTSSKTSQSIRQQPKELRRTGRHLAAQEETKLDKIPTYNNSLKDLKRKSLWSGSLETEEVEDINAMETISLERINLEDSGMKQ